MLSSVTPLFSDSSHLRGDAPTNNSNSFHISIHLPLLIHLQLEFQRCISSDTDHPDTNIKPL